MKYCSKAGLTILLVLGISGCQSIGTKDTTFVSEVEIPKFSTEIAYELSIPKGDGPFPVVILLHGCQGTSPTQAKNPYLANKAHAKFLNENGFATAILDSFTSRNMGGEAFCRSSLNLATARRIRVTDAYNALAHLSKNPLIDSDKAFLIGQSNGGSTAVNAAKNLSEFKVDVGVRFRAIAAYYPWCGVLRQYSHRPFQTPLLIMTGTADSWTPMDGCLAAYERRKNAKKDSAFAQIPDDLTFISYPDAHHSFDLPIGKLQFANNIVEGNPSATEKSRQDYLRFFKSHL